MYLCPVMFLCTPPNHRPSLKLVDAQEILLLPRITSRFRPSGLNRRSRLCRRRVSTNGDACRARLLDLAQPTCRVGIIAE
jgi:hypothetical protein